MGVHVDETYLVRHGIAAIVDDAYLHASRMAHADIENAYLRTVEGICIVVSAHLQSPHIRGTYVGGSNLQSPLHAHGDIRECADLHATEWRGGYIIE